MKLSSPKLKKLLILQERTFHVGKIKKPNLKKFLFFLKSHFSYIFGNRAFYSPPLPPSPSSFPHSRIKKKTLIKFLIKFIYSLNKTPLRETGCLSNLYYVLAAQASTFPNIVSQNTFGTLLLTVQYLLVLWDAMKLHWSPSTSHPTLT